MWHARQVGMGWQVRSEGGVHGERQVGKGVAGNVQTNTQRESWVGGVLYGWHRGEALTPGVSQVAGRSEGCGGAGGGQPWARQTASQRAIVADALDASTASV